MYSNSDKSLSDAQVKAVIEDIKSMHFLGSSNHTIDPTGGLSGYYRNVAAIVYAHYRGQDERIKQSFFPYLMMAAIRHTGAGNCGEMAGALYAALHLQELTANQKKSIQFRSYDTNDSHGNHAYVLVGESVFDIWADKHYKKSRIKAETNKAEKYHRAIQPIDPNLTAADVSRMNELIYSKFSAEFENELSKDRQTNRMYVTFDSTDPSDFALFANHAFPWLFNKFNDTVTNNYFKTHPELARDIQAKILKNAIYLIEELRKDVPNPSEGVHVHTKQRKHSDDEIKAELSMLLNNDQLVTWLMAMSYYNLQPELCVQSLEAALPGMLSVKNDALLSLLISQTEQTIMQLTTSTPESDQGFEGAASSTGNTSVIAQPSTTLSNHVTGSIFRSPSPSHSNTSVVSEVDSEVGINPKSS